MLFNVLYLALLTLASPIVAFRMIRHGRYRRGIAEKLFGLSPQRATQLREGKSCIWIHAVSVGEVNLLPGLIEELRSRCPETSVVVSTSTDTGYDLAIKLFGEPNVFFCPLDFTWAVRRTMRSLQPTKLILTELELWPNLIHSAKQHGVSVNVINGRLSQGSGNRYRQFSWLTKPSFQRIDWVGCQDEATLARFANCGVPERSLTCTGSIKFDNAPNNRELPEIHSLARWAGVDPWHRVWIVGSTQAGEEQMAISVYQRLRELHSELRLIIVPRHVECFEAVATLIEQSRLSVRRRSQDPPMNDRSWESDQVVLVDTIGELKNWWGVGHIATVGGSFGNRGGQNMLEPAGLGLAVSFGPNTKNFRVIADALVQAGGAVRLHSEIDMERFVRRCLCDIPAADELSRVARSVVEHHRGAIKKTVDAIASTVSVSSTEAKAA